ncbi:MAG: glycerate kinase [Marinilabiliales bacterium]|nr:glycerate kinase [Marinilabiliales bacterium]
MLAILKCGLESVQPERLIAEQFRLQDDHLLHDKANICLSDYKRIFLIGFGKASARMALAMEHLLGERIESGFILTKYNHSVPLKYCQVSEAGHPIPDSCGIEGCQKIVHIVKDLSYNDLLIVLISGGGSALLADPVDGLDLESMAKVTQLLVSCGATIHEINAVRKHLSVLKGGQLARLAAPARVLALSISDVVGDHPDVIASGPTTPDLSTFDQAYAVLEKYDLTAKVPGIVREILSEGVAGKRAETPKPEDPCWNRTTNIMLGNNEIALEHSVQKAVALGFPSIVLSDHLAEDVKDVAEKILEDANRLWNKFPDQRLALFWGGEPTVSVRGNGLGGRNQHLALLMTEKLANQKNVLFLSAGTDGTDGPTDAAGAYCSGETMARSRQLGLNHRVAKENFDSYHFFKELDQLIITGPTHTNVMDLMILLRD